MSDTAPVPPIDKNKKKNRRKRGPGSPAEGDSKRQNQAGLQNSDKTNKNPMTSTNTSMEDAVVEIAARVGECVTAHGDFVPTLNTHSDLLLQSSEEIKTLNA